MKITTYLTIILLGFLFFNGQNKNNDYMLNKNKVVKGEMSFQNDIKPVTEILEPLWSIKAKHGFGTPLVQKGIVFLPMGLKFAVDAQTGEKLYFKEDKIKQFFKKNFKDSIVLFNSDERVSILNLYSGELVYDLKRTRSWPFYNTPEFISSNNVCIVINNQELINIDLLTKKVLWTFKTDNLIYDKIITRDGEIFFNDSKNYYCYTNNGTVQWQIELGEIVSDPVIIENLLYVYVMEKGLCAINIEKREIEWFFNHKYKYHYIGQKILVDENLIYFIGPSLYAVDRFTGELVKEFSDFKSKLSNPLSFINEYISVYTDSKRMIPNICIYSKEGKKEYEYFTSDIYPPQSEDFPFSYMEEYEFMFAENIENNLLIGLPANEDSLYCFKIKEKLK